MTAQNVVGKGQQYPRRTRQVKLARAGERLTVFLGSCVSIVLWHPAMRIAAMSHILLPYQPLTSSGSNQALFASGAWQMMQSQLADEGVATVDCVCHVIGAAQFVDNGMESGMGGVILREVLSLISAKGMVVSPVRMWAAAVIACSASKAASGRLAIKQHATPACGEIAYGAFTRALCTTHLLTASCTAQASVAWAMTKS